MPAGASNPVAWLLRNNVGFSSVNRADLYHVVEKRFYRLLRRIPSGCKTRQVCTDLSNDTELGPRHQCSLSVLQGPEGRGRHCDQLGGSGGRRSDQWSPDSSVIHWVEWGDGGVTRGAQTAV
ncbi:unnamed protein product [Arctogadus glacialis]